MITAIKNNLKKIDNYLFDKKLYKKYCQFHYNCHKKILKIYKKILTFKIKQTLPDKIDIFYLRNNNQQKILLGSLFDKYGSTKSGHHYYEDIYDLMFRVNRDKISLVLECGIGHKKPIYYPEVPTLVVAGAGLRAYRDYFYNAEIIGIDIDSSVLFTEDRIKTYVCDQTSSASIDNFIKKANIKHQTVDIIIDDGCTDFIAKITLFKNCCKLLTYNGVYIIENIYSNILYKYVEYFNRIISNYQAKYISLNKQEYSVFVILITKNNLY